MKYLKVNLEPIKIKGDVEDLEQLQVDLYEKIVAMVESETLAWSIDEDDQEDECDF